MTESFGERLTDVEEQQAKFRDDTDEILLSEITERIQEAIHRLEIMDVKLQGIDNRSRGANRLLLAIGAAVALTLLWQLL